MQVDGHDVPEWCEFKGHWEQSELTLYQCLKRPEVAYKVGGMNDRPHFLCETHMQETVRESQVYWQKQQARSGRYR